MLLWNLGQSWIPGERRKKELCFLIFPNPLHMLMRMNYYFHRTTKRLHAFTLYQYSSVQSLSHVRLFVTPWIAAHQPSLSITKSWSSLRLTSIESVMPSSHLSLCHSLLLLPPIPPSIRVFSNELTLHMKYKNKCLLSSHSFLGQEFGCAVVWQFWLYEFA